MQQETNIKKTNPIKTIAIVLFVLIIVGAGGLFWLYRTEKKMAKNYADTAGNISTNNAGSLNSTATAAKSWVDGFNERLKSLYNNLTNNNTKTPDKSKNNSSGGSGTSSGSGSGNSTGTAGIGQPGPLDTDVPWREEGEADPDYSYKEVRACGALVKGPPEISSDTEQFNQEYQEYLAWIEQDCRDAYSEAGKEYPF